MKCSTKDCQDEATINFKRHPHSQRPPVSLCTTCAVISTNNNALYKGTMEKIDDEPE